MSQESTAKRPAAWIALAVVLAAFAFSLHLVGGEVGLASPWFGMLLMMCVLGTFALARPIFLPRMPRPLRAIGIWEREPAAYRSLWVPAFGALLKRPPLRYLNPEVHLQRHRGDAAAVHAQVEAAEAAHFWAAWVLIPYVLHAAIEGRWAALAALLAVEIATNAYPILHLRLTRGRIDAVLERRRSRRTEHCARRIEGASRTP